MINYFKKLDYFSSRFEIKIFGKSKYSSLLGFCLTVVILSIGIAVIITQGSDLFYKQKPRVNTNILYQNVPDNYTTSENGFAFAFTLESNNYEKFFTDKRYYNIDVMNFKREFNLDTSGKIINEGISVSSLEFELCKNNYDKYSKQFLQHGEKTGQNFTQIIENSQLSKSICLKDTSIKIGGEYNSGFFSNIFLQITKCKNKTEFEIKDLKSKNLDYIECASEKQQNELIDGVFLQFLFTNYVINTNNYTYPFYAIVDHYFLILDPTIFVHVDFYFRYQLLSSDNGLVFENNVKEITLGKDYFREIYAVNASNKVLNFYINISKTKYEIRRYYMKAQELAALVGGLTKFCFIIAEIISKYFNSYQYKLDLINQFFVTTDDFSKEPELKIKYFKLDFKEPIKNSLLLNQSDNKNSDINKLNENENAEKSFDKEKLLNIEKLVKTNNYLGSNSQIKQNLKMEISTLQQVNLNHESNTKFLNKNKLNDNNFDKKTELMNEKNLALNKFDKLKAFKSLVSIKYEKNLEDKQLKISFYEATFINLCICLKRFRNLRKKLDFYTNHLNKQTDYSQVLKSILSFQKFEENLDLNN